MSDGSMRNLQSWHGNAKQTLPAPQFNARRLTMLYYAAVFFIIAIIAGLLGFGGIAAGATSVSQVLFVIFLVLFLVSLITGLVRR
jgi:uncharacterized membrane protein YtjA (UPF0391 family)